MNKQQTSITLPKEIRKAMQEAAIKNNRTLSSMITRALKEWLELPSNKNK